MRAIFEVVAADVHPAILLHALKLSLNDASFAVDIRARAPPVLGEAAYKAGGDAGGSWAFVVDDALPRGGYLRDIPRPYLVISEGGPSFSVILNRIAIDLMLSGRHCDASGHVLPCPGLAARRIGMVW